MNTIVYIGNFFFPKGNSSGIRVLANGYLLRTLGYQVIYVGLSKEIEQTVELNKNEVKNYDGFDYYELPYPRKLKDWTDHSSKLNAVLPLLDAVKPVAVIAYGSVSNSFFSFLLNRWCKKNRVLFIPDCVDWLAGGSGGILFRIGKRLDTEFQKRYVNASGDGVIVVSTFLEDYYRLKGCKTLILPPLSCPDLAIASNDCCKKTKKRLVYAGFPFPTTRKIVSNSSFKDRLDITLDILTELNEIDFIFDIYGIEKEDYLKCLPKHIDLIDKMKDKIVFHGVVDNKIVIKNISKADFFVLIRDQNRMTNAGFPSKIVESISLGVPVITTATSDLDVYLLNGKHGFIVSKKTIHEMVVEFKNILKLPNESMDEMKYYCKNNNPFLLDNFKNKTKQFIDMLSFQS